MLLDVSSLLLLVFFALGSYIQATTGFAFGLIVVSSVSALGLAPIETTAFVVGVLSLINASIGLYGGDWRHMNRKALMGFLSTCLPATIVGVWLLSYLGDNAIGVLQVLLGLSIVLSSLVMMLQRQQPRGSSSTAAFSVSGVIGGLMGGMFSTFGPPITFMMYRQPDSQATIRATLLSVFFCTALFRVSSVVVSQPIEPSTLLLCVLGFPVVVLMTILAKKYPLPVSSRFMRFFAFTLLLFSGMSLLVNGLN